MALGLLDLLKETRRAARRREGPARAPQAGRRGACPVGGTARPGSGAVGQGDVSRSRRQGAGRRVWGAWGAGAGQEGACSCPRGQVLVRGVDCSGRQCSPGQGAGRGAPDGDMMWQAAVGPFPSVTEQQAASRWFRKQGPGPRAVQRHPWVHPLPPPHRPAPVPMPAAGELSSVPSPPSVKSERSRCPSAAGCLQ